MCFGQRIKNKCKLNCYTWNTVNTNLRAKYFFWYCLNTTVRKFNNSEMGAVNAIQKKFVYTKWARKLKAHFYLKRYCSKFIFTQGFICLQSSFYFNWEKSLDDIYHSPPNVYVITGNILITLKRFAPYHLLLVSNSTFMTDAMYLRTIQISLHLKEQCYYLISTASVIWQIDANCSPF